MTKLTHGKLCATHAVQSCSYMAKRVLMQEKGRYRNGSRRPHTLVVSASTSQACGQLIENSPAVLRTLCLVVSNIRGTDVMARNLAQGKHIHTHRCTHCVCTFAPLTVLAVWRMQRDKDTVREDSLSGTNNTTHKSQTMSGNEGPKSLRVFNTLG